MRIPGKRTAAIGLAGVTLAAGGGIAVAAVGATSPKEERDALLQDAAKRLGKSPSEVQSALEGALSDRLAAQVKAGTITQAQADEILQRAKDGGWPAAAGGPGRPGPGGFGGPGFGRRGFDIVRDGLAAAAKQLGLSEAKLREQLRDGKSLADVAKAQGKDTAALKSALTDLAKDKLAQAVKDKRLTQAQADELSKDLTTRVSDLVDGKGPGFGGPRGGGRGFHFGPGLGGLGPFGAGLDVAAKQLGLSEDKLRDQLGGGKSLADVAKAQGKDVAALKSALVDAAKAKVADAVKDKRLTQSQADEIVKDLPARIGDLVDGKAPGPGFGGPRGGHGPGFAPGGPAPAAPGGGFGYGRP